MEHQLEVLSGRNVSYLLLLLLNMSFVFYMFSTMRFYCLNHMGLLPQSVPSLEIISPFWAFVLALM